MKRIAICLVALFAATASPSQGQSLADALVAAYRHSNVLDQNRALLRAADEDIVQAHARLLPVVNFVTTALMRDSITNPAALSDGTTRQLTLQLSASLTLYDFGRGQLTLQASRETVLATRAALIAVEQQVLLGAARAWLNLRSARQTVELRRNNVSVIEQSLRAAQERFQLGDSTRTDVAIAEARLAAARSALSAAEGDAAVAREVYNLAVGRYPGGLGAAPGLPRLPATLAEAQDIARRNHPSILQAQHQVAAADIAAQAARTERYGAVTGQLALGFENSARNSAAATTGTSLSASISYSVPLYTGGRIPSAERQGIARAEAQRAGLHQTTAQVLQSVAANWSQLAVARAQLQSTNAQVSAAESAYEAVRAEADLGSRTTLDVLNAEQELLDARSNQILAGAGVQQAAYALLESMGRLTVESLNLGIPTYDVNAYSAGFPAPARATTPSVQGQRLDAILGRQPRP